jgi:protease IV
MDSTPPNAGNPQPVRPQVVPEYVIAAQPRRSGGFGRFIVFLVVLGLLASLALNVILGGVSLIGFGGYEADSRVREEHVSHQRHANDKVAILPIEGAIISGEGFFRNQVDHALKDAKEGHLKALVIRVNSPGGTISGSDYMFHHLRRLAKETNIPIVVSMGGMAASGGYYVSMCVGDAAETIFAEPTTWTGSIGVIIPHYNVADLMKNWGIKEDSIASDRLKQMGSMARPMTEEERKIFQGLVEDGFKRFKDVIKQGRPKFQKDPAALDKLATGQVFTADQALAGGLVDKIGFIEDAVDRAIALAGLDKNNVSVVRYKAEHRLADLLLGSEGRARGTGDLSALWEMASPKAYYLYTSLPPLAGTTK